MTGKTLFLILLFIFCFTLFSSQKDSLNYSLESNNNVYLSFLGDGNPVALNYERIFQEKENLFHAFKMGISYYVNFGGAEAYELTSDTTDDSGLIFTNHITFNYGRKYTYLEVGIGTTYYDVRGDYGIIAYPIIGVRRQSNNGSVRLFCHPFHIMKDNVEFIFPVGFSLGISF
ncbi:MAG: hypothetical protein GQ534_03700 [Candidatus Delongbacteria bacterium]|nr:hypothetical protein [Candidatus Delongbacteria bacterium]